MKDRLTSLFQTDTTENYSKATHVNNVYGDGGRKKPRKPKNKKKQSEGNIMKAINERMTRDVTDFFEQEENY